MSKPTQVELDTTIRVMTYISESVDKYDPDNVEKLVAINHAIFEFPATVGEIEEI